MSPGGTEALMQKRDLGFRGLGLRVTWCGVGFHWAAVQELKRTYHSGQIPLFAICLCTL